MEKYYACGFIWFVCQTGFSGQVALFPFTFFKHVIQSHPIPKTEMGLPIISFSFFIKASRCGLRDKLFFYPLLNPLMMAAWAFETSHRQENNATVSTNKIRVKLCFVVFILPPLFKN
jgi:hypothetical protein